MCYLIGNGEPGWDESAIERQLGMPWRGGA
jgi:hypothetical protein